MKQAPMSIRRLMLAGSILAAAGLMAGCVVAPIAPPHAPTPAGDVYTDVPPPPPQAEYVGPPPAVGYVWIGGHWGWRAGRHVWIGGNWAAPRPGWRWVPYGWSPYGPRWRLHGGYWSR